MIRSYICQFTNIVSSYIYPLISIARLTMFDTTCRILHKDVIHHKTQYKYIIDKMHITVKFVFHITMRDILLNNKYERICMTPAIRNSHWNIYTNLALSNKSRLKQICNNFSEAIILLFCAYSYICPLFWYNLSNFSHIHILMYATWSPYIFHLSCISTTIDFQIYSAV